MSRFVSSPRILTVKELTGFLKELLEGNQALQNVWVRGEVSNCRLPSSGHMYFTLKDESASIRCVMFRSQVSRLIFRLEDGLQVLARGYVSLYERDGQYQLYVQELQPAGVGDLHLAFQQLKVKLEREGLFNPAHKSPIPVLPRRIGIVTSPTGAAIRDLITIITRRCPGVELVVAPAAVQGDAAPAEICLAMDRLNRFGGVDVIIVGRGGGSLEELWAFNTEPVARAIFASRIPVISAVGHETDFTIADFVADLRAPTPSAAAELVVPLKAELYRRLGELSLRLEQGITWRLEANRAKLGYLSQSWALIRPESRLNQLRQYIDTLSRQVHTLVQGQRQERHARLAELAGRLEVLSPLGILQRGYALCRTESGAVIREYGQVAPGQRVDVVLARGSLLCRVEEQRGEHGWQLARRQNRDGKH